MSHDIIASSIFFRVRYFKCVFTDPGDPPQSQDFEGRMASHERKRSNDQAYRYGTNPEA